MSVAGSAGSQGPKVPPHVPQPAPAAAPLPPGSEKITDAAAKTLAENTSQTPMPGPLGGIVGAFLDDTEFTAKAAALEEHLPTSNIRSHRAPALVAEAQHIEEFSKLALQALENHMMGQPIAATAKESKALQEQLTRVTQINGLNAKFMTATPDEMVKMTLFLIEFCPNLGTLDLTSVPVPAKVIGILPRFPRLHTLSLRGCPTVDDTANFLRIKTLENLDISYTIFDYFRVLPESLKTIRFTPANYNPATSKSRPMCSLGNLPRIEKIDVSYSLITCISDTLRKPFTNEDFTSPSLIFSNAHSGQEPTSVPPSNTSTAAAAETLTVTALRPFAKSTPPSKFANRIRLTRRLIQTSQMG